MIDKAKSIAEKIRTLAIGLKYGVSINDIPDILDSIADELDPPEPKEGTAEWALNEMFKGWKVTKKHLQYGRIYWTIDDLNCVVEYNCDTVQTKIAAENWCRTVKDDDSGWCIYNKKPTLKVGDWVEVLAVDETTKMHEQISSIENGIIRVKPYPASEWSYPYSQKNLTGLLGRTSRIIRKLDPREVEVEIKLRGTVSECSSDPDEFFCLHAHHADEYIIIAYDDIDGAAETIRELIKSQEEKSN